MAYKIFRVSYNTTGVKTFTCGFQPVGYRVTITPPNGGSYTTIRMSIGESDLTNHTCDAFTYHDSTHIRQQRFTDRVGNLQHWDGAAWTAPVVIEHDSVTATELKLNYTAANNSYQVNVEAWD